MNKVTRLLTVEETMSILALYVLFSIVVGIIYAWLETKLYRY